MSERGRRNQLGELTLPIQNAEVAAMFNQVAELLEIEGQNQFRVRASTAARELGCHLEINSQPERLDLNDAHIHTARQAGAKFSVSTDAHSTDAFAWIRFGIDQARRGWLTAGDVINTRSLPDLRKLLRR